MMSDWNEYQYVHPSFRHSLAPVEVTGPVFLYELNQRSHTVVPTSTPTSTATSTNTTAKAAATSAQTQPQAQAPTAFLQSLQNFLELDIPLIPMIRSQSGRQHNDSQVQARLDALKINICDPVYEPLRAVLMEQAVNASRWIRNYFIHGRDVVVASPEHFVQLMEGWERDPCLDRVGRKTK
jgi:hypothetical protein